MKLKDLTGQKFGRLTVIERAENAKCGKTRWLCKCDCSNEVVVQGDHLKCGLTQSCGCLGGGKLKDLTGMKFGRLTVLERAENKGTRTCWLCKCDCGNEVTVLGEDLKSGHTQSCGCLHREQVAEFFTKHGMCRTSIYNTWCGMLARCYNSECKSYPCYGGRGIKVYPDWINDFQAFYDYVSQLENFGVEGYTLDRIDNEGNYEPGNLRWADIKAQNRNTRRNIFVEYNGEQMCLKDAAQKSGINYGTLQSRYSKGDRNERLFRPKKE